MPTSGARSLSNTWPATPIQAQPRSLAKFSTMTLLPGWTTNGAPVGLGPGVGVVGVSVSTAVGMGEGVSVGISVGVPLIVGAQVGPNWISGVLVMVGNPKVGGIVGAGQRSGPGRNWSTTSIRPGLAKTAATPLAATRVARRKTKVKQFSTNPTIPRRGLGL